MTTENTIAGEQWCPNATNVNAHKACKCRDLGTPPSNAAWTATTPPEFCHYPAVRYLEIDPRNGFAYASTLVGLLTSPDGGSKWLRFGSGTVQDCAANGGAVTNKTVIDPDPYAPEFGRFGELLVWPPPNDPAKPLAARLLTHQYVPICGTADAPRSDNNAFNLNAWPENITHVGRMALSFQSCEETHGTAKFYKDKPTRKRGTMTAALPVEWRVRHPADPSLKDVRVSGVMVAYEPDDCQGDRMAPGALTFRDSASVLAPPPGTAGWGSWTDDNMTWVTLDADKPNKLPRQQTRRLVPHGEACAMRYFSAAVAPSDDRVLYTWGFAEPILQLDGKMGTNDIQGFDKASVPLNVIQEVSAVRACNFMTGLYRSLDRGHSWHLAGAISEPNVYAPSDVITAVTEVDLSVAPHNPYLVTLAGTPHHQVDSGSGYAVLFEPAKAGQVYGEKELGADPLDRHRTHVRSST